MGDVLVCSWGYDQTNVDWYRVVAVTKASVRLVEIGSLLVSSDGPSDRVMPNLEEVPAGPSVLKRVKASSDGYSVSISSYSSAYLWDGKSKYRTGFGYGH